MFGLFRRHKEKAVDLEQERQIELQKKKLATMVDRDLTHIDKLNEALSNGVTIKIYHIAAGGKHGH